MSILAQENAFSRQSKRSLAYSPLFIPLGVAFAFCELSADETTDVAVAESDVGRVARPARPHDSETAGARDSCHSGSGFATASDMRFC